MLRLLIDNPMLLLFVVGAIGYPLGHIKILGSRLGVAAVLFVGLAAGALHPEMKLPELVYQLGLVLFVYTVGLSSGRQFFAAFRRKGLRDNLLVTGMLASAALLTIAAHFVLKLRPALSAGLFCGSLTNTPALAGVIEYLKLHAAGESAERALAEPVVAFSLCYPAGVIGVILAIQSARRFWKIDYDAEAAALRETAALSRKLFNRTVRVTREEPTQLSIEELCTRHTWDVAFGRMKHGEKFSVASASTRLASGDLVSVVGSNEDLDRVVAVFGEVSNERLDLDRSEMDYRRVFVSNPKIAGQKLGDLHLPQQLGAAVTRIRRGDIEMLAHDDTVLELGDRVRVVARREDMDAVARYFGDSYRALSEVDVLTFSLGLALGLLVGMIPLYQSGSLTIRLGFAGGPLVVALILGALGRSGPLLWTLPYSANLTLRQVGLVLFLAGIGTRAGFAFVSTLQQGGGGGILIAGIVITLSVALLTLWIGYRVLKIPMSLLMGMLAGLQTQPAVLGFALEETRNDLPNIGYAAVFPAALILKIILAQLLVSLL